MKILNITPCGLYDYTAQLANALKDTNNDVVMVTSCNAPPVASLTLNKGIQLWLVDNTSGFAPLNFRLVIQMMNFIRLFKPDIIHIQTVQFWYWLAVALVPGNCPIIVTFHDPEPHRGENGISTNLVNYWARMRVDHIIVLAQAMKKLMISKFKTAPKKISVIPHGERYSAFKPWHRSDVPEENLVLFFGRIVEYKGLEYLIKAQPYISEKYPSIRIIIAGEGDFSKYMMQITDPDKFIIINRFISHEEAASLFQRCKVVVLPYIEGTQTGIAQVAYGFGKPVVATNVGGLPEMVEHEKTGLIVEPADARALADAVAKLLKDDDLRRKLSSAGQSKLENEYSWANIASRTLEIYQDCLERKATR